MPRKEIDFGASGDVGALPTVADSVLSRGAPGSLMSVDELRAADFLVWLAHMHTVLGDEEAAIAVLERIVGRPSRPGSHELRTNPWWDALREHPRFQELLARARP